MSLSKRYKPDIMEPALVEEWLESGVYHFTNDDQIKRFDIDTPPATVSGYLHLGHVYSYSHADFIARYRRMKGYDVLYPMGYDDNGLPTERLVESHLHVNAVELGRRRFIEKCVEVSREFERSYQQLWQRLGLSIDWRFTYQTIDERTRRLSQLSFLDLYKKDLVYRQEAPTIWCPECQTAIAQAELSDLERESEFITIDFRMEDGYHLPIATTRPELLTACVAVIVHPDDSRYTQFIGKLAQVPLMNRSVPIIADEEALPELGTGVVMCCTFGDTTDVSWWYKHNLDLIEVVDRDGRMKPGTGFVSGMSTSEAREHMKAQLGTRHLILNRWNKSQSVRVHERCDTPVEFVITAQWFIRVLDFKEQLLASGDDIEWYPDHMINRFRHWVTNLRWDWCISRQRFYGVPFPVWFCAKCGSTIIAHAHELPVDPIDQPPSVKCSCGSNEFFGETDVMDTWATSSLTPQIVGTWSEHGGFDGQEFLPVTLHSQAHEIIRTWAFYSIVKALHHFGKIPWKSIVISGWGLAPEGSGKISKSRGGGPATPMEMIDQYSADALRYWAASTGLGKDAIISEEKIQAGLKLVNKLWNVARFSQRFLDSEPIESVITELTLADRWILSRLQNVIANVSADFELNDYAAAKSSIELFFWHDLADNYLEMVKKRLYDKSTARHEQAKNTLYLLILNTLQLFSPFVPFVTDQIFQTLFAESVRRRSIHQTEWPVATTILVDPVAEEAGNTLVAIATAVRRFKSHRNLPLNTPLSLLTLASTSVTRLELFESAEEDIISITRADKVSYVNTLDSSLLSVLSDDNMEVGLKV